MRKILSLAVLLCTYFVASAQEAKPVRTFMESNQKMYVVVAVLVIIFSAIIIYLLSLDRRLKKLEE